MSFSISEIPQWLDFVTLFDNTYSAFENAYSALTNPGPVPDELQAEYNSVLAQANADADTLQGLAQVKADAENFLAQVGTNLTDFPGAFALNGIRRSRSGLGLAPLVWAGIGAAAAVGAVYVISGRIADYLNMVQKIQYANSHSVAEANNLFGQPGGGIISTLSGALMPFAIIAALIFLGPPVLKMLEGRK